jgi:hypothetical protein
MYNDSDPKEPYYLSKCLGKYTKNYIAENPGRFVKKLYLFTTEYWLYPNLEWYQRNVRTPHLRLFVMWALFVLAMIGFLVSLQKFKGFFPFYLVILGIWFSFAITVFLGRYKSSVAPFTVLFAAGGLYTALFVLGVYGKGKKDGKRGWEEKKDREDKAGREERRGRTEIKANKENEKRKKPQKKEIQKKEPKEGPPQENDGTKAAPEEAPKETSPVQEAQGAGEKKPEDREEQDHEAPPRESLKEVFGEDATAESLEKSAGEEKK